MSFPIAMSCYAIIARSVMCYLSWQCLVIMSLSQDVEDVIYCKDTLFQHRYWKVHSMTFHIPMFVIMSLLQGLFLLEISGLPWDSCEQPSTLIISMYVTLHLYSYEY